MIRILHSVSNMDRAGIESVLMTYYRHIDRTRFQFDFLCNKKKPGDYDQEILSMGGRIYRGPGLNPLHYGRYLDFMRQLLSEHPEYSILEAHNGEPALYALYAAERCKLPVRIMHAHSTSINRDYKLLLKILCKSRIRYHVTHRWACGEAAAVSFFGQRAFDQGQCTLIRNAIVPQRFAYQSDVRERMRAKHGLQGSWVLGHVGRFKAVKNHAYILEVFAALRPLRPNAKLLLIGEGELMETTRRKAEQMGLMEHILMPGSVGNANEWYQAMDAFILPSLWEGLPVVGVEAQAAGLPCYFSDRISPEIGITPLASFLSIDQPARAWAERLASQPERPREDQTEAIRAAGYDISTEVSRLEELYTALAAVRR